MSSGEAVPAPGPPAIADGPASDTHDERLWRRLLLLVEAGEVVPIVGRELLEVAGDAGPVHLYARLAERVAARLGLDFDARQPTSDPLNTVACRYFEQGRDTRELYINVFEEAKSLPAAGMPEPLRKLAEIGDFKLFVTTTFDGSLVNAVNTVRFNGLERTIVRAFAPKRVNDLPGPLETLAEPAVFHLLGRAGPTEDFVVTEEDALEFLHSLQQALPANLFGDLHQKDLLVIGCRFPAWLVRSFLRLARPARLRQSSGRAVFVVDSGAREDRALIDFLRTFKTRTEVFEQASPVQFVNELHARWTARRPPAAAAAQPDLPPKGAIFVSYASEDRAVAEQIVQALADAKLDAWLDRDQIMAGDRFMKRIEDGIRRSQLFIPVLSRHCLVREERFFRKEWRAALDKSDGLPGGVEFILPVAIDDVPYSAQEMGPLRDLSWYSLRDGRLPEFVAVVKERYRKNQGD
jgi:hypothetical protein